MNQYHIIIVVNWSIIYMIYIMHLDDRGTHRISNTLHSLFRKHLPQTLIADVEYVIRLKSTLGKIITTMKTMKYLILKTTVNSHCKSVC